jgi:predicted nucleic acid-binding protein
LANAGVCDLLLRLAEEPHLLDPVWSEEILNEVRSVHIEKLRRPWPEELADYWQQQVRKHFPEAMVEGYAALIEQMTNHEGDRHVLAAAIQGRAQQIVTFNLKHFQPSALEPWHLSAVHPQDCLLEIFQANPEAVVSKLNDICTQLQQPMDLRLAHLAKSIPHLSQAVANRLKIEL